MEYRNLKITLVSAQDLPNVRLIGRMKVYAKVSVKGSESETTKESPVDMQGKTNPRWDFCVEYTVSESSVKKPGVELVVRLFCKRTFGDRFIGEVSLPVKSLFDMRFKARGSMSCGVTGTPCGRLNILFNFGVKVGLPKHKDWTRALRTAFFILVEGILILIG